MSTVFLCFYHQEHLIVLFNKGSATDFSWIGSNTSFKVKHRYWPQTVVSQGGMWAVMMEKGFFKPAYLKRRDLSSRNDLPIAYRGVNSHKQPDRTFSNYTASKSKFYGVPKVDGRISRVWNCATFGRKLMRGVHCAANVLRFDSKSSTVIKCSVCSR